MKVSQKNKMLVSVFPSGRSVVTILKDGKVFRTVSTGFEYEEILKAVNESETGLEVKERVWNEKMFQVSDAALILLEAGVVINNPIVNQSKKKRWWPFSWPK